MVAKCPRPWRWRARERGKRNRNVARARLIRSYHFKLLLRISFYFTVAAHAVPRLIIFISVPAAALHSRCVAPRAANKIWPWTPRSERENLIKPRNDARSPSCIPQGFVSCRTFHFLAIFPNPRFQKGLSVRCGVVVTFFLGLITNPRC